MLYRIKPLVWRTHATFSHTCATIFGDLAVSCLTGHWYWELIVANETQAWKTCTSLEDGKAKAEAYYRKRLMQALVPAPD